MINLIRSEVLKVRSTQVWFWLLLLSIGFTTLVSIGTSYEAVNDTRLSNPVDYYAVFTSSRQAGFALMVLGVLGLTTEFRHKTITPTLLATPDRWRLLAGKVASYAVFSVLYAIVCIVVNVIVAVAWLSANNVPVEFGHGVPGGVIKNLVSLILLGMFGLGIGALIRNQAAALVFAIVYLAILNPILSSVVWIRKVWMFEPGGALAAFTSNGRIDGLSDDVYHLSPMAGFTVLAAWCVGLLVLGGAIGLTRDIS
jgi:hypothetical protein